MMTSRHKSSISNVKPVMKPGALVVFEGPDNVGKTTLSRALLRELKDAGHSAEHYSFPGQDHGTLGHLVYRIHHCPDQLGLEEYTKTSLQLLHLAAHLDTIEQRILPALERGIHVILDRFWWSTWTYGLADDVPEEQLKHLVDLERLHWKEFRPTLLFLLSRDDASEINENAKILRNHYESLLSREKAHYPIHIIQNNTTQDKALHELVKIVDKNIRFTPKRQERKRFPEDDSTSQMKLLPDRIDQGPSILSLAPAKPTVAYDTLWRFAAERQAVFYRKMTGRPPPWTTDPIIAKYKFTNTYRASDRVSQYLIRHVIYNGDQAPDEVFFRIILFKLFNKIETWQLLEQALGSITYADYNFTRYDETLRSAMDSGRTIYSAAYIMPPGTRSFGHSYKHQNHLALIENMMTNNAPERIASAPNMKGELRNSPFISDDRKLSSIPIRHRYQLQFPH